MQLHELKFVTVSVTNPDGSTYEETYEPFNSRQRPMHWALISYDKSGLYFRYPDMAKNHAYSEVSEEYRDNLALIQIACMKGGERAELKKKKK